MTDDERAAGSIPRPPFDPQLVAGLATLPVKVLPWSDENWPVLRESVGLGVAAIAEDVERWDVSVTDYVVAGPRGDITLSRLAPREGASSAPGLYYVHGGGMLIGDRFSFMSLYGVVEWVARFGIVVVTVDYRMAPDHPGLAAVEDCHAGLVWMSEHAAELGIDPARIIIAGMSGGGGLAAGTALLNRDRHGPELLAQVLWCPMLDDRSDHLSALQFSRAAGPGATWSREDHQYAWNQILGEGHEEDRDVSIYAAANRATELHGLPPTFMDVGASEPFRDPVVEYASKLWAAGVSAELHIWPGGFHGFDALLPEVPVSAAARAVHEDWLRRILATP